MTVYFHGNFGLNRNYMAGVLKAGLKDPRATGDAIAAPFGYKAPFTARYKSWLNKTGLITERATIELTSIGEVVWRHDPKLQSLITQWLLHHELTGNGERAEAWHYFALEFLPKHASFSKEDLLDGLAMKLSPHSMQHFGPGSKLNQQIARKILQVYTEPSGLGDLGLIAKDGKSYKRLSPKQLGPWKTTAALEKVYR